MFTCPDCLKVSRNPHDAEHRYCGWCHEYKTLNLDLSTFQIAAASALHSEYPKVNALKAAVAFQAESGRSWGDLFLEAMGLFHAPKLTQDQYEALNELCGFLASKQRSIHP